LSFNSLETPVPSLQYFFVFPENGFPPRTAYPVLWLSYNTFFFLPIYSPSPDIFLFIFVQYGPICNLFSCEKLGLVPPRLSPAMFLNTLSECSDLCPFFHFTIFPSNCYRSLQASPFQYDHERPSGSSPHLSASICFFSHGVFPSHILAI